MSKTKFPIIAVILCVSFAVFARVTGIVYSTLATNVVYSGSIICQLLPALRQVLSALSFACAAGGAMSCILAKNSAKSAVLVYTAVILADSTVVILIDLFSGIFEDDLGRLFMGIGYRLGLAVYSVLMLLLGVAIAKAMINRGGDVVISVTFAAVLPVAVDFFAVLWKSIASLIEWEFMPYAGEIYTMLFEVGIVLLTGVLSAVVAMVLTRKRR